MWEFIADGKGRRARVLQAKSEEAEYNIGDLVEGEEFLGVISAFKRGNSESSHTAQSLSLLNEGDDLYATSKTKWVNLNDIDQKSDLNLETVHRAINHRRRNLKSIADSPEGFDFTDSKSAFTIDSLFAKSQSPKKRRSPQKQSKTYNVDDLEDSERSDDSDEESVPARKRTQKLTTALAAASIQSPQKPNSGMPPTSVPALKLEFEDKNETGEQDETSDQNNDELISPELRDNEGQNQIDDRDESPLQDTVQHVSKEYVDDGIRIGNSVTPEPHARKKSQKKARNAEFITLPKVDMKLKPDTVSNAIMQLHPASDPATHLCREDQFDQLFVASESAISAQTGTCIYVSGTPGTGKTSMIKEVIGQLDLRVHDGELNKFTFLEINGMKLVHANAAYEHLWEALGRGQMAASNAMTASEAAFTADESLEERGIMVVLLDELDQLVTKGQQLMYNFFNWPSLPNSRSIVLAVANTMDLPERVLSNKISSRVGLTRVQFPGYTFPELREIIVQRLEDGEFQDLAEPEALEYAARKVAGVGGDVRRALDFVRQAISLADSRNELPVKTAHVRDVIMRMQSSPIERFSRTLGYATKVMLCAILTRTRRTDNIEAPLHEILRLANQSVRSSAKADISTKYLYTADSPARLKTFQSAVMELVESGILVQQAIKGEATPFVRSMIPVPTLKEFSADDSMLQDII